MEALILDCLAKDPDDRPTAEEVRSRLEAEMLPPPATQAQPAARPDAAHASEQRPRRLRLRQEPGRVVRCADRAEDRGGLLAVLALLAVLVVIGALAAPNLFGGGGRIQQCWCRTTRGAGTRGPSGGGWWRSGPERWVSSEPSVASLSASQSGSEQVALTAQAAEQTMLEVYTTAADGDYDTSYGLLPKNSRRPQYPHRPSGRPV